MKKISIIFMLALIPFFFACQQKNNNNRTADCEDETTENTITDEIDENIEEEIEVDPSTVKYSLLGIWQDVNDPTYKMELTGSKFKNYIEGSLNWDQDWELANGEDDETGTIDDNGQYIWVYHEGDYLYRCKIIEINDQTLKVEHISGGLKGSHEEFERVTE